MMSLSRIAFPTASLRTEKGGAQRVRSSETLSSVVVAGVMHYLCPGLVVVAHPLGHSPLQVNAATGGIPHTISGVHVHENHSTTPSMRQ